VFSIVDLTNLDHITGVVFDGTTLKVSIDLDPDKPYERSFKLKTT